MNPESDTPYIETVQIGDLWIANCPSMGISSIGITKEYAMQGVVESIALRLTKKDSGYGIKSLYSYTLCGYYPANG